MTTKKRNNTVIVTTERVIQTINTIKCTDEELAALRACKGKLNEDVLTFITDHSDGKDKTMLTATVTVHRCEISERNEKGKTTRLVKWNSGDFV